MGASFHVLSRNGQFVSCITVGISSHNEMLDGGQKGGVGEGSRGSTRTSVLGTIICVILGSIFCCWFSSGSSGDCTWPDISSVWLFGLTKL